MNLSGSRWKAPRSPASADAAGIANERRNITTYGPTVFVVDSDYTVRSELKRVIELKGYRVQSFASAEAFLRHGMAEGACLLLVEVNLRGLSGPGLQNILLRHGVLLPIVFMTDAADISTAIRALQSGAISFLSKPLDESKLMAEIENALAIWHDEFQQRCEIANLLRCYSTLTPREREMFLLAADAGLSGHATYQPGNGNAPVKPHRSRVMKKMHAQSEAELALMAQKLEAVSNHSQGFSQSGVRSQAKRYAPSLLY